MIVFQSSDNRRSFASDDSADLLEGGTGNLGASQFSKNTWRLEIAATQTKPAWSRLN